MREANSDVLAALASNIRFAADLYKFSFPAAWGGSQYWTGADCDLTFGTTTWLATGPIVSRGGSDSGCDLSVAEQTISLAPGTRTLNGVGMKLAAIQGAFDGVPVLVQRAYMLNWGTIPGLVTVFSGTIQQVRPTATDVQLTVASGLSRLTREVPARLMTAGCPYLFCDSDCGLNAATYTDTTPHTEASSTTRVVTLSASSSMANAGAILTLTSGPLSGTRRVVRSVDGAALTLASALPSAPAHGVTVSILKGCDKTRTSCRGYSNIAKFGGFPDLPKPAFQSPVAGTSGGSGGEKGGGGDGTRGTARKAN